MNKKLITKFSYPINNPGFDIWGKVKKYGKKLFNKKIRSNSKISLRKEIIEN